MKNSAWQGFQVARERFKKLTESLAQELPGLKKAQQELVDRRGGPAYLVETPVLYNQDLDKVGPETEIKLILVADNPGRREQAAENRRYLVGPSGKIAEKFFRDHPGLGIDFRENVLILNKIPIHTPRTAELRELVLPEQFTGTLEMSQRVMAEILLDFHRCLSPLPVWIIGYSEMKKGGIFQVYTETLRSLYEHKKARRTEIFLYRHFSMNQFTIDLHQQGQTGESLAETLSRIGRAYRERILGW